MRRDLLRICTGAALLICCALPAAAQYKWIGPDGRVNYGDRPPDSEAKRVNTGARPIPAPGDDGQLPYTLRMVARKYPVSVYTSADCRPCDQAKQHLARRGVPYVELTIRTPRDLEAFKRAGFTDGQIPAIAVGGEKVNGFSASGLDATLDLAGYPGTSQLPRDYRNPPAQPVAGAETISAPKAEKSEPDGESRDNAPLADQQGPAARARAAAQAAADGRRMRF